MKKLRYLKRDGNYGEIEYDENAPCISCGKPVINASVGGTSVCPKCDGGEIYTGTINVKEIKSPKN